MAKRGRKKMRMEFSERSVSLFKRITETLADRGTSDVNIAELLESALEQGGESLIDDFVTQKTPTQYKIEALLQSDPAAEKKLIQFVGNQSFGLKPNEQSDLTQ